MSNQDLPTKINMGILGFCVCFFVGNVAVFGALFLLTYLCRLLGI